MGIKISDLTSATTISGSEELPIVQGGNTKKATVQQINAENYSTTEQVVGTWIDGKPLYRKVGSIVFTSQTGSGAHTQGSLIDDHISYCAIDKIYATNCGISTNLYNGYNANYQNNIYIEATQSNVNFGHVMGYCNRAGLLNMTIYVVVSYTKTTDNATRSINLMRGENTGSLVGIGDKTEVTDKNVGEQLENEPIEKITVVENETEGSGDIK